MNFSKIHVRYAKAFFQHALEKKLLENSKNDMELLLRTFSENDNFSELAANPLIKGNKKLKIFGELFANQIHPVSLSFLEMLLANNREAFLPGIARRFIYLYKKEKKIVTVTLTSAENLENASLEMILTLLRIFFGCEIEFELKTDEKLIGGFHLRIDDLLLDASIHGELKKIRNDFNEFVCKKIENY